MAKPPQTEQWRDPTTEEIDAMAAAVVDSETGEIPWPEDPHRLPISWMWTSNSVALQDEKLDFLHKYWMKLRGDLRMPLASQIDALDLKPVLGFVLLLDVLDGGFDCRYRLYGSGVSSQSGRDWTGVKVSEMNRTVRSDLAVFYRSTYLAVARRGEPLFTLHGSQRWQPVASWRRLILPLADGAGAITRFMVGNIPTDFRQISDEELQERAARVRGENRTT